MWIDFHPFCCNLVQSESLAIVSDCAEEHVIWDNEDTIWFLRVVETILICSHE